MKSWETKVLRGPDAADRVAAIEDELRIAVGPKAPSKTTPSKTATPSAAPAAAARRTRTPKQG